jgi:hypothetical protein
MNTNLKITQVGPLALYIEINGWIYHIDDSENKQIMVKAKVRKTPTDPNTCCVCKTAEGDVDELLVEGWVTFCNPCLDEIERLQENTDE